MTPKFLVGVGWYSEEQWTMLKLLSEDRDKLNATYGEWEAGAQKAFEELGRKPGIDAVKVFVDVEELRRWCRERGKPLVGSARAEYVVEIVQTMSKGGA